MLRPSRSVCCPVVPSADQLRASTPPACASIAPPFSIAGPSPDRRRGAERCRKPLAKYWRTARQVRSKDGEPPAPLRSSSVRGGHSLGRRARPSSWPFPHRRPETRGCRRPRPRGRRYEALSAFTLRDCGRLTRRSRPFLVRQRCHSLTCPPSATELLVPTVRGRRPGVQSAKFMRSIFQYHCVYVTAADDARHLRATVPRSIRSRGDRRPRRVPARTALG